MIRALSRSLSNGEEEEVLVCYQSEAVVQATSLILPSWKPLEGGQVGEVYVSRHQLSILLLASADFQILAEAGSKSVSTTSS